MAISLSVKMGGGKILSLIWIFPFLVRCWTSSLSTRRRRHISLHASFDFSSTSEWDIFYQENGVFEWHSSVPLDKIASFVEPNSDCLMVGCGNSRLPQVVLSNCRDVSIVLSDTSQTCLDQLQTIYGSSLKYKLGDSTKLSTLFEEKKFDIIIDKGLSDAILCGDGWDGPLTRLFEGASIVLNEEKGIYLLVSYKLPPSTKNFLTEVGQRVGLNWQFDLPESNDRVSVSVATKQ